MERRFIVTIQGGDTDVSSLKAVHVEDAVADGLRIPFEDVTAAEVPE